ncbi:MAG: signal peptidase I [Elusimicrobia bacterium]|nr:signal peptidase I [Elusimicrobiota bacterium]
MLSNDLEWADTFFSAVLLASFLMYFVLQAFKIPSGSMRATLLEGDHLFVNKFIYGIRIPMTSTRLARWKKVERGDVVVFRFPTDDTEEVHCGNKQYGKDFIKRAVGLPGDKVEVKNGVVFVNDKPLLHEAYVQTVDAQRQPASPVRLDPDRYQNLWQDHQLDQTLGDATRDYFGPVKLPADEYFVMGDNRDRSCDSRFWGPVSDRFLKGKAWFIYWPPDRIKGVE